MLQAERLKGGGMEQLLRLQAAGGKALSVVGVQEDVQAVAIRL
jgi:hypothetical protein